MQYYDASLGAFTRSPSYYLFDQRRMDAGPLTFVERGVCGVGLHDWSDDNAYELARGWIGRGSTASAAAAAVGSTPSPDLDESVAEYNAGCAAGVDRFGRLPQAWSLSTSRLTTAWPCTSAVLTRPEAPSETLVGECCRLWTASRSLGCTERVSSVRRLAFATRPPDARFRRRSAPESVRGRRQRAGLGERPRL